MLRCMQSAARLASTFQLSVAPGLVASTSRAARSFADQASTSEAEDDLARNDVYGFFAKQMHKEAGKNQAALKKDVMKIVDLLEDASPDADSPFEGKLKDALPFMGKRSQNELFRSLMEEDEFKNMHAALKGVMTQLSDVGETACIVPVVYSYLQLLDGPSAAGARSVEMTLASQEPASEVESKKAMLLQDMMAKGMIGQSEKVTFNVKVDPAIGGGVVYNLGDTIVDCSYSTLQNEFFSSLSAAGIQRVE
eukprot:jgi/Ulvmu1/1851/UM012_0007.1